MREDADRLHFAGIDALLLLVSHSQANNFRGKGDFHMDPVGKVTRRRSGEIAPFVFAGVQILRRALEAHLARVEVVTAEDLEAPDGAQQAAARAHQAQQAQTRGVILAVSLHVLGQISGLEPILSTCLLTARQHASI